MGGRKGGSEGGKEGVREGRTLQEDVPLAFKERLASASISPHGTIQNLGLAGRWNS